MVGEEEIRDKFALLMPHLNERQRRLLAGAEARSLGRGGIALVSRITGMSRSTIHAAIREIDEGPEVSGRIRRPGGGRRILVSTVLFTLGLGLLWIWPIEFRRWRDSPPGGPASRRV